MAKIDKEIVEEAFNRMELSLIKAKETRKDEDISKVAFRASTWGSLIAQLTEAKMEATKEQIASGIVRNLSIALAKLCEAQVDNYSAEGVDIRIGIQRKLQKWIDEL